MKTNKITHKLDGNIIEPNTNDANVRIILRQNTKNPLGPNIIKTNSWSFPHAVADILNNRIAAGGSGITEGPVYSQEITDENGTLQLYEAALNLAGKNVVHSCDTIENIEGILLGKNQWLAGVSKTVFFRDLDLEEHYIQVPYKISILPNYKEGAIATITGFIVVDKVGDMSQNLGKLIAEISSILGAIAAILKAVIVVARTIIILALIIQLITDVFDHLLQPLKYHAGMLLQKLLEVGCNEIGLGFSSTIFDDPVQTNLVLIPAKPKSPKDAKDEFKFGFTVPESTRTNGEYAKSLFDLLEVCKLKYYADIDIIDGVLHLETKGNFVNEPTYELPDLPNRPSDPHRTNLQEAYISDYDLSFAEDLSDENTIDNYKGNRTHAITKPVVVDNQLAVFGGRYLAVPIPFSRASRKETLNDLEKSVSKLFQNHSKAVNTIIKVANAVIKTRNAIIKVISKVIKALRFVGIKIPFSPESLPTLKLVTPNQIQDTLHVMLLSKDFFVQDKLVSLDINSNPRLTKVRADNADKINSEHYYLTYHKGQSLEVTPDNPTGSQFNIYKHSEFHLCKEGAIEIINNRNINTFGKRDVAEVLSCDWFAETGISEIEIAIPTLITDNYKTELITPDGL